ncbi:MAG TPA: SRPBCC family protein [Polyangium sp.]|nr:SRPBCC family protein [Polyangium sp.]
MWFDTKPSDTSYADMAPHRIANVVTIEAPPQRVFDIFATADHQDEWMPDFKACRWTSSEPHGVGATREIELKMLTVKERFLIWENGKHLMFSVDAATLPIITQMVEEMRFEPIDGGAATRFVWHVYYTPARIAVPIHPAARAVFGHMFGMAAKNLVKWVKTNG